MTPVTEVRTNPNPAPELAIVNGGAAAPTATPISFPIRKAHRRMTLMRN
jgi:hypothetical protein